MTVHYVPARKPTPDVLGAVLEAKVERELIPLNKIRSDGGTQMRAALNEDTVKEYEEKFNVSHAWGDFPPVVLFFDGTDYWVADGFHRIEAYRRACGHPPTIPVHAEVRAGSRRDAILFAAGANANHGLRRTNADKRRAVEVLLRDPEWAEWSNREIARQCNVSLDMVNRMRDELTERNVQSPTLRKGADGRTYNVSNIGTNQPKYQEIWQLERIVARVQREHDALPEIMRAGAQHGIGSFWGECQRQAKAAGEFRLNDLRQAVNNVAHQVEVKAAGTNFPNGKDLDPWAVALQTPGSRQQRSEALARAITPWIQAYRDAYGRNWQDLALNGNPAHTNSTFWGDIGKECKRRLVTVDDDTLKLAIKQAFAWLLAEEPPKTQPGATQQAAAAEIDKPLMEWTEADWAKWRTAASESVPAAAPVSNPAPLVAPMPVALLKGNLRRWLGERYNAYFTYQMLDNWMQQASLDDLEAFTATLPAGWTQDALDQAIRELHEHFAPDPDEQDVPPVPDTDRPVIGLDNLVVVDSVTAPALDIPLPNFAAGRQPDPEPESDLDSYDDASATVAAKRMNKLHTLKVRFGETINLLEDFGDLTGRHTASLLAKRELTNLIGILETEMDALQKGRE